MERSRKFYKEQRILDATDLSRIYWRSLVNRVYDTANGYETISEHERLYFSACMLDGEIYNGGFDQFFTNSSGAYYYDAIECLKVTNATESLRLCQAAKQIVFGFERVPKDRIARNLKVDALTESQQQRLGEIDKEFCEDPDKLGEKLLSFAHAHNLFG